MNNHRNLAVFDAADLVVSEVDQLLDSAPRPLIHIAQLRDSAQSASANISEGFGRGKGGERNRARRVARGEAEEAIRHLKANLQSGESLSRRFGVSAIDSSLL